MSHIFISHVEADADVALAIAVGLEQQGFQTWCYEVDSIPGVSYLVQTGQAIQSSSAVVLIISPDSLGSNQVTTEVVRAHESRKPFVPVRRDITHVEFQARQPEWREAIGAATSIGIPSLGVADVLPRITEGLRALAVHPQQSADPMRVADLRRTLDELNLSEKAGLASGSTVEGPATVGPMARKGPRMAPPARKGLELGVVVRWSGRPVVRLAAIFLAVAGAVALGVFLIGRPSGGGGGAVVIVPTSSPRSPADVLPLATPTVSPSSGEVEMGLWSGTTSQGRGIEFDVVDGGDAIDRIVIDVEGECPLPTGGIGPQPTGCTCEVKTETTMAKPWPIADTGFSYAPGNFEFSAVFDSSTTAHGFVRVHSSGTAGQSACSSDQVTWTASLQ